MTQPFSPFTSALVANEEREAALKASGLVDQYGRSIGNTAKRWANANGYYGAQGGWIYSASHKPVAQGWGHFFDKMKYRMLADVQSGKFTPNKPRSK